MTRLEHLLTQAGEECAEVAQRTAKALRFGLDEMQDDEAQGTHDNPDKLTNRERIRREFLELCAVLEMIDDALTFRGDGQLLVDKTAKVEKYLQYAFTQGTLEKFT